MPEESLLDLRARLANARWPEPATEAGWTQGVPVDYLETVHAHWLNSYDWRAREARLNTFPHYRTEIDGLGVHFVHARSKHENALPLVLTHGWPGSFIEFLRVIEPLTQPERHGGHPTDAFHVICPSLPGYGFSDKPVEKGWNVQRITQTWSTLMKRLGYERFGAAGSDWGTTISTLLGRFDPNVIGIHVVPPLAVPDPSTFGDLTSSERQALDDLARAKEIGSGYAEQQTTRPQTIGYSLVDSPLGLAAWIIEKLHAWSDCNGDPANVFSLDEMIDNIMLYWIGGTGASSARLYWESFREVATWFSAETTDAVSIATGCSIFPKEVPRVSRRWAEKRFTNIVWWNELSAGGHFAAWEQPELFANELRSSFRIIRQSHN